MPPKGLKVGFGRGKWFVRKPHLFQLDVVCPLSFLTCIVYFPPNIRCVTPVYDEVEEYGMLFSEAQDTPTGIHSALTKHGFCNYIDSQYIRLMLVQGKQTNIWVLFALFT